MDNRAEVREFLMSRRAKITPERVGLPAGGARRVPGLRRSEVAALAGLSVEYYAKLERGAIGGASASVLDALATALMLDDTERSHLVDLARAADGIPASGRRRRPTSPAKPPHETLLWVLESIKDAVAFVRNDVQDIVAINELGRAFYSPIIGDGGRTPNLARFQFLDPASRDFYPDWEIFAQMCVAILRNAAGKDPHDRAIQDLVGELSTQSKTFRELWAAHDVRTHGSGTKRFNHPVVGELNLAYEELSVTAESGLALYIYTAEPGSDSYQRLQLLASWSTTPTSVLTSASETPTDERN
ncbi:MULTISPECIES: helix-turn-helix transcriptional regulator [unclassified Brevibacterium]|uniref:helix-turn-helix transcriptional regulator n=1 Tax=unclassified Brevibacterium TaxID=2614124 RepID=UPI001092CDAB|nr:helix-turn-helix transcriptional regulator [Brevibacterium sp. S22]TGD32601.1 XRE family transcriptional regulator [Brevibacterium sp. S22]